MRQARVDALAEAPPMRHDIDAVVAAGRQRRARRRLLQGGGALVTAAAVLAAVLAPRAFGDGGAPPVVGAGSPAVTLGYPQGQWEYGFRGYIVGEFTVTAPQHITPGYQELYVRRGTETSDLGDGVSTPLYSAVITVYRPGVFRPARLAGAEQVLVNGRPGLYGAKVAYSGTADLVPGATLAWQYSDDAWAVATSIVEGEYDKAELTRIAAGLAAAPAAPATVALKATSVPAGYVLTSAGVTDDLPSGAPYMESSIRLNKTRPAYAPLTQPVDPAAGHGPSVRIALYPVEYTDTTHRKPGGSSYCNPGNANLCFRMSADGKYLAEIYAEGGAIAQSELLATLRGLQFADPARPSTWFPVTSAVPATAQ
ncbi:hypothetical protein [Dactylosporangium sp. CA-233914]|uniref:hypothetical protein n=1 Tax=Dactylosporangium sp. CA-233914 TaxID=3239934 RepID=UPI003D918EDB